MTRRSDGKISFGVKEWLGIAGVLVAIAIAWGKMDATIRAVNDRVDRFELRTRESLNEIKAELRDGHRDQ